MILGMLLASSLSPINAHAEALPLLFPEPVVIERPYDPVACNCWLYIKNKIPEFPNTKEIIPNSVHPVVGGVIILQYKVPHYVLVEKVTEEGVRIKESNYGGCGYSSRLLSWEDLKEKKATYWYKDI